MTEGVGGPLRILHVIDGLGVGGAEVQLVHVLRRLPRDRFDHVVCHITPQADLAAEIRDLGVPVHDLSRAGRRSMAAALVGLVMQVRCYRPALIHADGVYGNLCGRLAGAIGRVPVLTTVGNTLGGTPLRRVSLERRVLLRRAIWQANRIASRMASGRFRAVTEVVRDSVIASYGVLPDRVAVVYRGVDLEQMATESPEALSRLRNVIAPPDAWPLLLNVGRLARQKGQEYLIRALLAVRRGYPNVCLLLVGEGPLEAHYRAVAQDCGVSDAVRFLGRRSDVTALLQCADIFVFPSLYEGAAGAMLEAMAARRPIVASKIPTIEEAVRDAALLVPPRNPDGLADAILHLSAHPELWPAMGARARHIIEDRFDIRRTAAAFGRLCEEVTRGRASAPDPAAVRVS